jgi:hypothetical protein
MVVHAWLRTLPLVASAAVMGLCLVIWAWANLMYVPDVCCDRAASWIATELSGSVRVGERWVVPT